MEKLDEKLDIFLEEVTIEIVQMLETESKTNEHIKHLQSLLKSLDSVGERQAIADYGMNKISDEEDHDLASYFFVLSNMKVFSKLARDFFTDVMVHCEDLMSGYSVPELLDHYKKIRPTL
jgi:hypothetical protein